MENAFGCRVRRDSERERMSSKEEERDEREAKTASTCKGEVDQEE